ncbi:MAG: hypothetical protein MMC23_002533 [Stictis urceolatum]|nr:hypothetical protein [Stictis urceolata]
MQSNPAPDSHAPTLPQPPSSPPSRTLQTTLLHADTPLNKTTDVAPPLHVSTTYQYSSTPASLIPSRDAPPQSALTPGAPHIYSRETAPNTTRLESLLTQILNAPSLVYGSGLAAIFAIYTLLNPRKVAITGGYHGAHGVLGIFERLTGLRKFKLEDLEAEIGEGDVVHLETPVNPYGEARDLAFYSRLARERGAWLVVDATLAPPPLQDPFVQGADLVMHSGTKYFGGHSDLLMGVLATRNQEWLGRLAGDRLFMGNVAGNMEAWLGVRSLRTLGVRVERQSASTGLLVAWMDRAVRGEGKGAEVVQKVVEGVRHVSLQPEAREEGGWVRKQMSGGWGPLFAFTARSEELAKKVPSKLSLFVHATSLGGVESLIEWRAMSDSTCSPTLLRVSVGLESWENLRDDLIKGFAALAEEEKL